MTEEHDRHRVASWNELLEKMIDVGLGAAMLTAETAQKVANDLVARGQVTAEESTGLVDRLLVMGKHQRDMLQETVEKATEKILTGMHLARQSEVDDLCRRVEALERALLSPPPSCGAPATPRGERDEQLDQE